MQVGRTVLVILVMALAVWVWLGDFQPDLDDFEPNDRKMLFVGIEGADWERMVAYAAQGDLPFVQDIQERTVVSFMDRTEGASMIPPGMHPTKTWATITTGQHPPEHGVHLLPVPVQGSYEEVPATSLHRRKLAVWEILSRFGVKVAVVGGWGTWPAEWVNGSLVSERFFLERFDLGPFGSHGHPDFGSVPDSYRQGAKHLTYPEELDAELTASLAGTEEDPFLRKLQTLSEQETDATIAGHLKMLMGAVRSDLKVASATQHLLEKDPELRFTACFFHSVDVAAALFYKYDDPRKWESHKDPRVRRQLDPMLVPRYRDLVRGTYGVLDRCIRRLMDQAGADTTLAVTSGHRFGPHLGGNARSMNLNPVLAELGLLKYDAEGNVDYANTRCFDRPMQPWHLFRLLSLNYEGKYPSGFVPRVDDTKEAQTAAWKPVFDQLARVTVAPPWRDIANGQTKNILFFAHYFQQEHMGMGIYTMFPPETRVRFPSGKEMGIDELFVRKDQSGRHVDGGFLAVTMPGDEGRRASKRTTPFGKEYAFRVYVAPTVLALFDLPRGHEEGEMAGDALYWMMDSDDAQWAASRRVPSLESAIRRSQPGTPLGDRHLELLGHLRELGYLPAE